MMRWTTLLLLTGLAVFGPALDLRAQETESETEPQTEATAVDEDSAEAAPAPEATAVPERRYLGEQVSIFTDMHIKPGEVVRAAVCIFCDAVIEGEVERELVVVGGSVVLSGKVGREMTAVLSDVTLGPGSEIEREFVNVLGDLDDQGAQFGSGQVNIPIPIKAPFKVGGPFPILAALLAWGRLLSILVLFVVVLILVAFVPDRIRVISEEAEHSLPAAYLAGLLGYLVLILVMPTIYFILLTSVIGIPVIPILGLIEFVLKTLGIAGLLHFIGVRMGRGLNREMSLLGAILLGFLPWALLLVLPAFFGFVGLLTALAMMILFWLVIKVPALGLVILTRCGGRSRSLETAPQTPAAPPPVVSPEPPVPPPAPSTGA